MRNRDRQYGYRLAGALGALAMWLCTMPAGAQSAVTKYADMAAQIHRNCAENPDALHCFAIGSAAVSRRPILMVRVSAAAPDAPLANSPRLLVICRQHGDEPVSTEAALQWLSGCAAMTGAQLRQTLGSATVYIVPMANPDGADKLIRLTATSGDMNRDWGVFALPETRALYAVCKQLSPSAVIDMHSWDLTDAYQANSVEAGKSPAAPAKRPARKPPSGCKARSLR